MMDYNTLQKIKAMVTGIFALVTARLGVLAAPIYILIFLNMADYATGFVAAPYRGERRSSAVGFRGIAKKICMWLLVALGGVLDWLLSYAADTIGIQLPVHFLAAALVAVWLICNELVSILENIGDIGVEMPPFIMRLVRWVKMAVEDKTKVPDWDKDDTLRGGGGADTPKSIPAGAQLLTLPIQRMGITAGYKNAKYKAQFGFGHYGVDAVSETGDKTVCAMGNGKVLAAGPDGRSGDYSGMGWVTVIRYDKVYIPGTGRVQDLIATTFHHEPNSIGVKVGDKVTAQTVVARYGNTGGTTLPGGSRMGAHLHLQLDTDTGYPFCCSGISGKGSKLLQAGTVDSTIDPRQVLVVDEDRGQRAYIRDAGWSEGWDKLPRVSDFAPQEDGVSLEEYKVILAKAEAAEAKSAALEAKIIAARAALG